jgi:hypothetical protein
MTRQFIFQYSGKPDNQEIENVCSEVNLPKAGDTIERHGREWRVHSTLEGTPITDPPAIPAYKIFLIDY